MCSMLVVGVLLGTGWAPREGTPGGSAHGAGQLLLQSCLQFSGGLGTWRLAYWVSTILGIWCLAYHDKLPTKHEQSR